MLPLPIASVISLVKHFQIIKGWLNINVFLYCIHKVSCYLTVTLGLGTIDIFLVLMFISIVSVFETTGVNMTCIQ